MYYSTIVLASDRTIDFQYFPTFLGSFDPFFLPFPTLTIPFPTFSQTVYPSLPALPSLPTLLYPSNK